MHKKYTVTPSSQQTMRRFSVANIIDPAKLLIVWEDVASRENAPTACKCLAGWTGYFALIFVLIKARMASYALALSTRLLCTILIGQNTLRAKEHPNNTIFHNRKRLRSYSWLTNH